ncbi:MAG: DHH family phosphoesterase [Pirellulaceae bacterium]
MAIDWRRFVELVQANQRFVLTSHIRPDCDALGSELGMAGVLEALGKEVWIVNGQETPPNLAFIDPERRIKTIGAEVQVEDLKSLDVLMVLDTSAWAQLGPMGDVLRTTDAHKIVLDHHQSEDDLGAELFKNVEAEATGRLVVEAAEQLGVALTAEMANPLFAALATDTGWFRFPSARAGTYRVGAKLIEAGANPPHIYGELYERDSLGRVRLRGEVLTRITLEHDGRLGYTYVLNDDFARLDALPSDTEDLINLVLGVAGTEVAVIFIELASGGLKVSFRSRCALDCSQLSQQFGGGGHKAAAGATIQGTLDEVRDQVLDAVRAAMP